MSETAHTPGPWDRAIGSYGVGRTLKWEIRKHEFDRHPYEGDLQDECGIYPPARPVALVAGEANARLISAAPDLLAALKAVEWSGQTDAVDGGYVDCCPCCGHSEGNGHYDTCRLAKAIAKADGRHS